MQKIVNNLKKFFKSFSVKKNDNLLTLKTIVGQLHDPIVELKKHNVECVILVMDTNTYDFNVIHANTMNKIAIAEILKNASHVVTHERQEVNIPLSANHAFN